jgi:hypothetical protein
MIRLVGGLVEELIHTNFKQLRRYVSVQEGVTALGFPKDLADFRHNVTHGTLGDAGTARKYAFQMLDWLRTEYWTPLKKEYNLISERLPESAKIKDAKNATHTKKARKRVRMPKLSRCSWWDWYMATSDGVDASIPQCITEKAAKLDSLDQMEAHLAQMEARLQTETVQTAPAKWTLADDFDPHPIGWIAATPAPS